MKLFIVFAAVTTLVTAEFKCPAEDGLYEDPKQCDKYYECVDGEAAEAFCPDGLVFDTEITHRMPNKRCDHPFNVDCGSRSVLQQPQPSTNCPRRNGLFPHPDQKICDIYYNCIDGEAIEMMCSEGLHFDKKSGDCVWGENSGRQGCIRTVLKTEDGFQCPNEKLVDANDQIILHPKYANPNDCQKFYVCMNGVEPRILGCPFRMVYNGETQKCDAPKNVRGCENWYKDIEDSEQVLRA